MSVEILKLKQEYEALRTDRSPEEQVWDEIEKFIMPLTGQTAQALTSSSPLQKTDVGLWDLTAPLAAEHLASALHADVTSPAARWLDLEWQDAEIEQDHDAVEYREKLAELIWSELQASDFGMEIASGYLEWSSIGNMALVVEPMSTGPEWKGLDFTAVPARQVQFVEDSRGGVLRWYRLLQWTPIQIVDHCARSVDTTGQAFEAPERIKRLAESPSAATQKIPVVFCVFRRDGSFGTEKLDDAVAGEAIAEKRPFGCAYFTLENSGEQLGHEGGYYKMPALMARWGKRPGTQWGYGRGHIALRHVKWLNGFKELQRNAAEKAVDPAHGVSERVGGTIDMRPGKTNVMPSKEDWWPLESAARFDVSVEVLRDERLEIRRCFHEDDLQLKESPQMTATEVQARKDEMNRAIGSPVARLQWDALAPIVLIVLDHLSRAKRLPVAPEIVKRKKAELKLRFRGPIARAQLMDEVVAIERSAGFIANLVKLGFPEARHWLNLGGMIREHSRRVGSPAAMFNSTTEAQKLINAERAAMAKAQAAATMKDAGQGMAAAASAGVPGAAPVGPPGIGEQPALLPSGGVAG
jgi:hypothetical protein